MRRYPPSGRRCDAVATTGAIFCSSRVTIGAVGSELRIRGRRNWVLLASPTSNWYAVVGEALKWVRQDQRTNGSASHWILIGIGASRGRNEPLLGQPRSVGSRGRSLSLSLSWLEAAVYLRRTGSGFGGRVDDGGWRLDLVRYRIVGICRDVWVGCPPRLSMIQARISVAVMWCTE